jgi:hypothetical protein
MQLENHTSAAAYLYAVNLLEPQLRVAAIVKKTYAITTGGQLAPAEDGVPLVPDQMVTDYGQFHGDVFFRKRGIDVCVLASVRLRNPLRQTVVRLEVGTWGHNLKVVGDRTWVRNRSGTPVASPPTPFKDMPISYGRAFGGIAHRKGEDLQWPDNPTGRGYYEDPEDANGKPLPNIEPSNWPSDYEWNARVPVAGWGPYPMYWGLRASRSVKVDPKTGKLLDVTPELFNQAHPELIVDEISCGSRLRLVGVRDQPLVIATPREQPHLEVQVGRTQSNALGELDGLYWWADAERLVVTWRARFRYAVKAEEVRLARLTFVEV